jgi:CheY-like chemotaxis protein
MRILVVEDQDSIRRMIEALVGARGHKVTAVSTGTKAIDVATTDPPDMVLLDLMIPGHDGFEVCRRLRSDPGTQKVPILIISAMDDAEARAKAAEAGATAFYTKPFSPSAGIRSFSQSASRSFFSSSCGVPSACISMTACCKSTRRSS